MNKVEALEMKEDKPLLAVGDRVRVNQHAIPADRRGQRGKIIREGHIYKWRVELDDGSQCWFDPRELVKLPSEPEQLEEVEP